MQQLKLRETDKTYRCLRRPQFVLFCYAIKILCTSSGYKAVRLALEMGRWRWRHATRFLLAKTRWHDCARLGKDDRATNHWFIGRRSPLCRRGSGIGEDCPPSSCLKINLENLANFWCSKTCRQNTTIHHQLTTKSPQKTIQFHHKFPQPPFKKASRTCIFCLSTTREKNHSFSQKIDRLLGSIPHPEHFHCYRLSLRLTIEVVCSQILM